MKHLLIVFAALLCSLAASAHDFEVDGIYYNITSDTDLTVEVTYRGGSYNDYSNEYSGAVTIPASIIHNSTTYSVTSIVNQAFYNCSSLTSITIPESVTSIGERAFQDCSSLTSITIPRSVTSIGYYAFGYCSSLTSITIPGSVTSIGEFAFRGCTSLASIIIQADVPPTIFSATFSDKFIPVFVPESSVTAYQSAEYWSDFTNIQALEATLIGGIWYNFIIKGNFAEVANIPGSYVGTVTIPATVTYEGVEYSVTSIGNSAFSGCISLISIIIPESVTSIGDAAFYNCSSLASITIPEGVTSIGERAFYVCSSLTSITIPEGVTSIGDEAFAGCGNLATIAIPESVTSIGEAAFASCSSLTSITIPEGVTSIGYSAFYNCISLISIIIPESVTSIGNSAFRSCSSLTSITIPESVTSIGNYAFQSCSSLTSITLPESVTSIGEAAFASCSSLTTVALQSSKISSIGSKAFANCPELLDVYCNAETVPTAEADAFDGSYPEYVTLHAPASAIESYKATAPWSSFGTIVSLTDELVTGITLSQTTVTMVEGTTLTLTATVAPIYATNPSLTWSSSDEEVATVVDGKVTAVASGTATITATASDGSGVSASCTVTVEEATYVKITINQYGSGTYCSNKALDFSAVEGLKAYVAAGYNTGTGVVTLMRVNTAKAGTGLFIKGDPGAYMVPIISSSLDNSLNMLVGTLGSTAVNSTSSDGLYYNYRYTIKDGDEAPLFYRVDDGYTLGTGKAYLQIPVAWLPVEAKSIRYRFDDGETTDMEEMEGLELPSGVIYDLMGRRVTTPQRGSLYLIDGKKTIY